MIYFGLFWWCLFEEERQGNHVGITCCSSRFFIVTDACTRTLEAGKRVVIWMCRFQTKAPCELRGLSHDSQLLPIQ